MPSPRPISAIIHAMLLDMHEQCARMKKPVRPSVRFGYAWPYITAMPSMSTADEMYGCDTGVSVILSGLSNLSSYRGDTAKRLKDELRMHLPERYR